MTDKEKEKPVEEEEKGYGHEEDVTEDTEEDIEAYERAVADVDAHASGHGSVAVPRTDASSPTVRAVRACLCALGLDDAALGALRVVHVTGTKGKGSTAALVAAALRASGVPRVGLYTSPHLRDVRERVRVDGRVIGRGAFARAHARVAAACPRAALAALGYFPLLTVVALAHFARVRCGAVVLEVGVGGRTDATNVVARPAVCAVTSLGLDHTAALGPTVADIAWEKAGIFRPGVPALTAPHQPPAALAVLRARAVELGTVLTVAGEGEGTRDEDSASMATGHMHGAFQRTNAVLAAAVVRAWWAQHGGSVPGGVCDARADTPGGPQIAAGFRACVWPGRAQTLVRGACTLHIDGAHTPESIAACVEWFAQCRAGMGTSAPEAALVFACKGDRAPDVLLACLARACAAHGVVFARAVCVQLHPPHAFHAAAALCEAARACLPAATAVVAAPDVRAALALCADVPAVLVTGSLYLVSEVLAAVDYSTTQ